MGPSVHGARNGVDAAQGAAQPALPGGCGTDKAVVLAAVRRNGLDLEFASRELRGSAEVCLIALQQNSDAFCFIDHVLAQDRAFILAAARLRGLVIQHSEFKDDKEVVLRAVLQNGSALRFASEQLRADKETVTAAIKSSRNVLR